jgi:hypothetical protein
LLDSRQDFEHNASSTSRKVEKNKADCFYQGQASRLGLGQRKGEVDLGSRCKESLPREEYRIAADALFYKINRPCYKKGNARYLTQHLCLHSLDYIVPSKYSCTPIEPGSFYP